MPRNVQVVRQLKLARILAESKRGLPLKTIAERHGWILRTLYRDIAVLEESGFAVIKEDDRFRLPREAFYTPTEQLQPEERLALFALRELAGGLRETTTGRAVDKLWQRLSGPAAGLPKLLPLEEARGPTVRSPLAIDYAPHRQTIAVLEEAIAAGRVVRCQYQALSSGAMSARSIEPGALHWDPTLESLYVIAWCRLRNDLRVFACHRFRMVALEEATFTPRRECRSATALRNAFRVWRSGNIEPIAVRLGGWAAREVEERKLHASQRVERVSREEVRVTLEVAGLEEATRWVLGYGALAVVEAPASLVAKVSQELQAASSGYAKRSAQPRSQPASPNQKKSFDPR